MYGVSKAIESETNEQNDRFLIMIFGTLACQFLGNLLKVRGIIRAGVKKVTTGPDI